VEALGAFFVNVDALLGDFETFFCKCQGDLKRFCKSVFL
jgi:hypothetical protein